MRDGQMRTFRGLAVVTALTIGFGAWASGLNLPTCQAQSAEGGATAVEAPASLPAVRALWVVRNELTSRDSIERFVDDAARLGFNVLIVQVSGRGDAFYKSDILPPAESLALAPPDFDPLATVIELAHARGLQVHAWLNDFFVDNFGDRPAWPQHVVNVHPEWAMYDVQGNNLIDVGFSGARPSDIEGVYVDPALPEVRDWVTSRFVEVVKKYDIDGIHHDFVRYPGRNYGYNPRAREIFREQYGIDPLDLRDATKRAEIRKEQGIAKLGQLDQAWENFRRNNITATVKEIHDQVKAIRPNIVISAAVFADYGSAFSDKSQAWLDWLKQGLIDVAVPMAYNTDTRVVVSQIKRATLVTQQNPNYGQVWAGLGAYKLLYNLPTLLDQTRQSLGAGAKGVVYFDYTSMANIPSYLDDLATQTGFIQAAGTEPVTSTPVSETEPAQPAPATEPKPQESGTPPSDSTGEPPADSSSQPSFEL